MESIERTQINKQQMQQILKEYYRIKNVKIDSIDIDSKYDESMITLVRDLNVEEDNTGSIEEDLED